MGSRFGAICQSCGHKYGVDEGGGFTFHLLRCDPCGGTVRIGFEDLGDVHKRYVKGLDMPYSTFTAEEDHVIQRDFEGEPLSREQYHAAVEKIVGTCGCGGQFRFYAPVRCPECRSTEYVEDPDDDFICYD